jgi:hypothetical protein
LQIRYVELIPGVFFTSGVGLVDTPRKTAEITRCHQDVCRKQFRIAARKGEAFAIVKQLNGIVYF